MIFSSTIFLFGFLPIVLIIDRLLLRGWSNIWLLLTSLLFFLWSQPKYFWIILLSIVVNYFAGIVLKLVHRLWIKKIVLIVAVVINLSMLFFFKYYNFFIQTLNSIFSTDIVMEKIVLPIGISFFTFQGLSYTIDVYRGDVEANINPLEVGLYVTLFPQLVAGPIVRYVDIKKEIKGRIRAFSNYYEGLQRFIVGLGKKSILADSMALIVDSIWSQGVANNTIAVAWLGSIAYTLQIFFDFSGYSDMAIGLGRMLGFHFKENFDHPYHEISISGFWRKWHISLSTWFRDYVYIPLGGNRKHIYINLVCVFLLTGLWHGAAWNYIIWGGYNAIFILLERFFAMSFKMRKHAKLKKIISHLYMLFVVNIGWILFRANSVDNAIIYIINMFGFATEGIPRFSLYWYLDRWNICIFVISFFICVGAHELIYERIIQVIDEWKISLIKNIGLIAIFLFSILRIVSGTYNPFIYFQF